MKAWAQAVLRARWLIMIACPALALLSWVNAPRFSTLLADDAHGFVPRDMPSQVAFNLLKTEFPDYAPASRAAVVFVRDTALTAKDRAYIAAFAQTLARDSEKWNWRIRAAAVTPMLARFFESPDRKAAVIAVDLPAEMLTHSTVNRVREVQAALGQAAPPAGLQVELTGNAALGELMDANAKRDVDLTTLWTFVAVIVILLWIYRSPIAMLLPLVTLVVALMLVLGLIGRAAAGGLPVNGLLEMFVIVLVVGTGVDYCLFLFARFREEWTQHADVREAAAKALERTGAAIIASTATNAAGLATLLLARHRDLNTSGPTIALALCLGTLIVLTFTPALISVTGRALLWPRGRGLVAKPHRWWWRWTARTVTRRPGLVTLAALGLLAPTAILGLNVKPSYDALSDFPKDTSFVRGAHLYTTHFHRSEEVTEFTLLATADRAFSAQDEQTLNGCLAQAGAPLAAAHPVTYFRHLSDPLGSGDPDELEMLGTLAQRLARGFYVGASGQSTRIDAGLKVDGRSVAGMQVVDAFVQDVQERLDSCFAGSAAPIGWRVHVAGEAPLYRDIRALRARDFRVVSIAASLAILVILYVLTRSVSASLILLGATLLVYVATYGATWLIFTRGFGTESISHQLPFLLFIILVSLGQDYNIYVLTRIEEEKQHADTGEAIRRAVESTGRVVSSCGIIMAAAFGSMVSGSLLLMKQFGVGLALGILLDTFIIRPWLVPALLMLMDRRAARVRGQAAPSAADSVKKRLETSPV